MAPTARRRPDRVVAPGMGRREHHDAGLLVDAMDRQAIDFPVPSDHDFDVGLVGPGTEQSRREHQGITRQVGGQVGTV